MTINPGQPIGDMIRLAISGARSGGAPASQADRILAALTLVGIAAVIVWPQGRPLPAAAQKVAAGARQVWQRRNWWLP